MIDCSRSVFDEAQRSALVQIDQRLRIKVTLASQQRSQLPSTFFKEVIDGSVHDQRTVEGHPQ